MLGRRLLPFPTTTIANRQQQRCRIAFSSSAGAPPPQQSASLYHEWYHPPVSEGVDKKIKKNRRPLVFLHGLLGNVRNVKSMAKKMCDIHNCPGLLLDLTGHGRSSIHSTVGSVTFDRVCDDLERTLREVLLVPMNDADNDNDDNNDEAKNTFTFVGHSLGGRLALHYAHNLSRSPRPTSLWLLDTVPGQPNESVLAVLEAAYLVSQRHSWRSRFELTTALTSAYNLPKPIAEWLAAQYDIQYQRFDFDLRAAESLADDFGSQDFWHQIDTLLPQMHENQQRRRHHNKNKNSSPPSSSTTPKNASSLRTIHLVQGGRNEAWEPAVPAIIERTSQYPGTFCHHLLPNAGHWVHVDDLPGLLRAFETATAEKEDF
jgi:pimeloyl-ACP methyl ester carboxylesterase